MIEEIPYHVHNGIDSPLIAATHVGGWSLVSTGTYTGDYTITGLTGDTHSTYMLLLKAYNPANTLDVSLRFNGDTGNNYRYFRHIGANEGGGGFASSTSGATSASSIFLNRYSQHYIFATCLIDAKQGNPRFVNFQVTGYEGTNDYETTTGGGIYIDGSAELTSINIYHRGGVNPSEGRYWLFRMTTGDATNPAVAQHVHSTSDITSGVFSSGRLAAGSPSTTTYLRGDQTWATVNAVAKLTTVVDDVTVNTAGEATLFSYTVPGGTLGTSNAISIRMPVSITMNTNGTLVIRLKYGGTTLGTMTIANSSVSAAHGYIDALIIARGATNSQEHFMTVDCSVPGEGNSFVELRRHSTSSGHTIDSTADQTLSITAQPENAGPVSGSINMYSAIITKIT